jgi:hypothetical protein
MQFQHHDSKQTLIFQQGELILQPDSVYNIYKYLLFSTSRKIAWPFKIYEYGPIRGITMRKSQLENVWCNVYKYIYIYIYIFRCANKADFFFQPKSLPATCNIMNCGGDFFYIYIYIYIYVWKLNQTVLELDFRAVKFLFFPRRDLNPHNWYTAAPFA